jgi:hypothetical protein
MKIGKKMSKNYHLIFCQPMTRKFSHCILGIIHPVKWGKPSESPNNGHQIYPKTLSVYKAQATNMTQTQHEPIEVVEKVHLHFIKK